MRRELLDLDLAGTSGGAWVISLAYLALLAVTATLHCFLGGFQAVAEDTGERLSNIKRGIELLIGVSCMPALAKVPSTHVGVSRVPLSEAPMVASGCGGTGNGGHGRITWGICYEIGGNLFSGAVAIGECEHYKQHKFYWTGRGH